MYVICFLFIRLVYSKLIKIAFLDHYKKEIEMLCIDNIKHCYFLIFIDIMIDYEKQVFITRFKLNM